MLTKNVGVNKADSVATSSTKLDEIEKEIQKTNSQYILLTELRKLPQNKIPTVHKITLNAKILSNYIVKCAQEKKDYKPVRPLLEAPVYAKNAHVQYLLGLMYLEGDQDEIGKGIQALEVAARQKHVCAQLTLGMEYYFGTKIGKNPNLALKYLESSAKQGNIKAQALLGEMFYRERDFVKVKQYLTQPATENQPEALTYLGLTHCAEGGEENFKLAYQYFERAAAQNNADAITCLGKMYYLGQGVKKQLDKAREYFETAVKQDNTEAQVMLACMYYDGNEKGEKNLDLAREYWNKAAIKGNRLAKACLGNMYFRGEGGPMDKEKAHSYLKDAADEGLAEAQYPTAVLYHSKPNKTQEDIQQAIHYYLQAANQGNYPSILGLIMCYFDAEELDNAIPWLEYLTQQDNEIARQILNADKLDDNAITAIFAQINKLIADVRIDLNLDSESELKVAGSNQSQKNTVTEPASESVESSPNAIMHTFSLPINDMEMAAEELSTKQAQLKAKSAERRAQKAAVALQIANNETIQLKPKNQDIANQIFAKKTKLDLSDFLKLFSDPFFQDSVQVKTTKSGFYIEATIKGTLEKTGSHHPHGGKEMNLSFLQDLGKILQKFGIEKA